MRAPFAYYGGKMGMAQLIVSLMPEHLVYIEPFFGSGSVFFAKPPAMHEIINDLDDAVVTFFRVLRDRPEDLERVCALTPHARAEFESADLDVEGIDDLERARRFWARVNQSFAKTTGKRTGWSVTTARTQSVPRSIASRIARFESCAERLMGVSIERCDAAGLVERLGGSDSVIYADPPYPQETRAGLSRSRPADYRHDTTEDLHQRLAAALNATDATVILSGYPCDQYDRLYAGWWTLDVAVTAHSSNARNSSRGGRVERIWSNRDLLAAHKQLELVIA